MKKMLPILLSCRDCGWREVDRDKHVDVLSHHCTHASMRLPEKSSVSRRVPYVRLFDGEDWELDEEGWPEIPAVCPLPKREVDVP